MAVFRHWHSDHHRPVLAVFMNAILNHRPVAVFRYCHSDDHGGYGAGVRRALRVYHPAPRHRRVQLRLLLHALQHECTDGDDLRADAGAGNSIFFRSRLGVIQDRERHGQW